VSLAPPTSVVVHTDPATLGEALAREILAGIEATPPGRRYLLGCPSGRSLRSTYEAMARLAPGDLDLRRLVIVMMDEYLEETADGLRRVAPDMHFSCAGFAAREIAAPLNRVVGEGRGVPPEHVWLPDPADPAAYDRAIEAAGGVGLFLAASGAGDGHVAFVPPGAPFDRGTSVIELGAQTRRDNLATFPAFQTLDEVPRYGVSVGLWTIAGLSRAVRLVMHGEGKQASAARVLGATGFDPAWPATFIHLCTDARILLDRAAALTQGVVRPGAVTA
jgi:glucosamine-6-phosphate deaminase